MAERVQLNPSEVLEDMSRIVELLNDTVESQKRTEQVVKEVAEEGNILYLDVINDNFQKSTQVLDLVVEAAEENKRATVAYVDKFNENEEINVDALND